MKHYAHRKMQGMAINLVSGLLGVAPDQVDHEKVDGYLRHFIDDRRSSEGQIKPEDDRRKIAPPTVDTLVRIDDELPSLPAAFERLPSSEGFGKTWEISELPSGRIRAQGRYQAESGEVSISVTLDEEQVGFFFMFHGRMSHRLARRHGLRPVLEARMTDALGLPCHQINC